MEAPSIGIVVAFAAGLISFFSPCVFPLIPSYVTFITGMTLDELTAGEAARDRARQAILLHGTLFVVGFTALNVISGATATFLGSLLGFASGWLGRLGGALLILFGLYLLGTIRLQAANREWRIHLAEKPVGYMGTVIVGVTFGAAWTPCTGPVYGGILMLAGTTASMTEGMGLLLVYSLGLAVPFLLSALLLHRFLPSIRRIGPWLPWINRISGAILVALGLLMLTDSFTVLTAWMARYTPSFLLERL